MPNSITKLKETAHDILSFSESKEVKQNIHSLLDELFLHQIELELQNLNLSEMHSQLEVSHNKYLELYNLAPVGYFTLNLNGVISEVNFAGAALLGINKHKLLKRSFVQHVASESQAVFSEFFRKIIRGNYPASCEVKMRKKKQGVFFAKLEGILIDDVHNEKKQILIIVSDITHYQTAIENELLRKQKATAEKNNREKDFFLANLSHELRTSLTSMLCWTQLLKKKFKHIEILNNGFDILEENIIDQNALINDLLNISEIVLGKVPLECKNIDLIALIEFSIKSVKLIAKEKNINIELITSLSGVVLFLDMLRIRQVLYNLLTNAIKFTPFDGQIKIYVDDIDDKIRIKIKDNGRGIKKEFLPYVFEPFTQYSKSHRGLGLGLMIAKTFLELQDGTIKAESLGENMGTTFIIELSRK